jgi:hypothetical protein
MTLRRSFAFAPLDLLLGGAFRRGRSAGEPSSNSIANSDKTFSERYIFNVWDTDDGLPQVSVNSILQTRDGYLWLATYGGLARFDGVRFTVFDVGNTEGLKSNRITELFEDREGSLWIGTEMGGVSRLKRRKIYRLHDARRIAGRQFRRDDAGPARRPLDVFRRGLVGEAANNLRFTQRATDYRRRHQFGD